MEAMLNDVYYPSASAVLVLIEEHNSCWMEPLKVIYYIFIYHQEREPTSQTRTTSI